MPRIRFRPGIRPGPRKGELTTLPSPHSRLGRGIPLSISHPSTPTASLSRRLWRFVPNFIFWKLATLRDQRPTLLVVNICGLPVSGRWSFSAIVWTVLVVGVLLLRARRPGIRCQTVFAIQHWVSTFLGVSWRHFFCEILTRCTERIRDFLRMRYINLHFTYLLTYYVWNFQYTKIHIIIAVKWVFPLTIYQNRCRLGPDPTGELTALPRIPSWFQGATSRQGGDGQEGREGLGGGGEGNGRKRREAGKREKLGDSALVVGG